MEIGERSLMMTLMKPNSILFCVALFSGFGRAELAADCTIYASPSGGRNGATASSPTTLAGANSASGPGSVICLKGGTYNLSSTFSPTHSGTSTGYITWKAYGDSAANFVWTG